MFQSVFHRAQSSSSTPGAGQETNEGIDNNRDVAQAIADEEAIDSVEQATSSRAEMISQAMRNYLLKSREKRSSLFLFPMRIPTFFCLEKVLDEKIHEYEIGRRHLARIMGEDPESFNQEKIDVRRKAHVVHRSISSVFIYRMPWIIFFHPVYSTNVLDPRWE